LIETMTRANLSDLGDHLLSLIHSQV
jgi:hypothetical protein